MDLGMNVTQMAELFAKIMHDHQQEIDKIIADSINLTTTDTETIAKELFTYSRIVLPSVIFEVVKANNQMISTQLEDFSAQLIAQLPEQK
jgi:hypothetical protein